ncbi:MAG: Uncharacterised protein [Flavobacteriales bacterium]|nr:MAG: Uncharacterised protein [Flavobacteriales bacterium]
MFKKKLFFGITAMLLSSLLIWAQPNMQPKKITEKFFKDYEDLELITPAFKKKKGYTNYEELISFLESYQEKYSDIFFISYLGNSQKGYNIPMVTIKKADNLNAIKVWLQGGLHGNESASTEGVLYLVAQILDKRQDLLENLEIKVVPMANIDGYLKLNRYAANGLDLNRDQTKLIAPESILLKNAFSQFSPQVAVDFHEYTPFRRDFASFGRVGISSFYDVMFLYTGNLNVPQNLRNYTKDVFVKNAGLTLDNYNFSHHPYVSTTKINGEIHFNKGSINSRSSATSFALTNTISTLVEVRGVRIGRSSFKRRTFVTYLVGLSYLETANAKPQEIRRQITQANETEKHIFVTSDRTVYSDSLQVIDLDQNELVKIGVTFRDALKATPQLIRKKPFAYIIKEGKQIIEKLKVLGIEVSSLAASEIIDVEAYLIRDYYRVPKKYEKASLQRVSVNLVNKKITFEKGTSIIYTSQKNANLLYEVLEPEAPNSFVSWGILKTGLNEELPIYRIQNNLNFNHEK